MYKFPQQSALTNCRSNKLISELSRVQTAYICILYRPILAYVIVSNGNNVYIIYHNE